MILRQTDIKFSWDNVIGRGTKEPVVPTTRPKLGTVIAQHWFVAESLLLDDSRVAVRLRFYSGSLLSSQYVSSTPLPWNTTEDSTKNSILRWSLLYY